LGTDDVARGGSGDDDLVDAAALEERVRVEQVDAIYGQLPKSTWRMLAAGLVMVAAMYGHVDTSILATWFGILGLNQALRLVLFRFYRAAGEDVRRHPRWGWLWAIGAGVSGFVWGAAGLYLYVDDSPGHQAFLAVALCGVTAGALPLVMVHRPSFFAFVLPVLLPLMMRYVLGGDRFHLVIAIACGLVLFTSIDFGLRLHQRFTESIRGRFREEALKKALEREMKAANTARAAAERATADKSRYLEFIAHDLRQPLGALRQYAEHLSARLADPVAEQRVDRLGSMAETMLRQVTEVAALESGAIPVRIGACPLQPLFDSLRIRFEMDAAAKGLELIIPPTSLAVRSAADLLSRILQNLVGNALRYTDAGSVYVEAVRAADDVQIQVRDTGPGIPEDEMAKVFEHFYRGSTAHGRERSGLGLGLYIVQRSCEVLGHTIDLASRPGAGCMFTVTCRIAESVPGEEMDGAVPVRDEPFAGQVVALVDDDPTVLNEVAGLLETWGFCVLRAASLADLLAELQAEDLVPDLLITDYALGAGLTGLDVVAELRRRYDERLPAFVITGDASESTAGEIAGAGLEALHKPVRPARLRALTHAVLHGQAD